MMNLVKSRQNPLNVSIDYINEGYGDYMLDKPLYLTIKILNLQ